MKVLVCLSIFIASSLAGFVTYPYVPVIRTPAVHNAFYPGGVGYPAIAPYKPVYTGFYDYRLGLTPAAYPYPGVYPGAGVLAGAPTIIHLVPIDAEHDKKKKDKKGDKDKKKDDKDKEDDDKKEEVEKAEEKDEAAAKDTEDVETV